VGLVIPRIEDLTERGVLSALDVHFARLLERVGGESRPEVLLAAALASRQVAEGHVCLDVGHPPPLVDGEGRALEVAWPAARVWAAALRSSRLVTDESSVGDHDGGSPLVLDGADRLYLRRYWWFERQLARALADRAREIRSDVNLATLREGLDLLFNPPQANGPDWQRVAAVTAVLRGLCVISGGPGTGKTFTVAKILALLAAQALERGEGTPRFTLLAPTGKAAARLGEAIGTAKNALRCSDAARRAIPDAASTIHRCLGAQPGGAGRFRHDENHPLATDLVLVDEASMVDLALMARLVRAVPPRARLILLGDQDQLASVEAGAVLGDVCGGARPGEYSAAWARTVRRASRQRLPTRGAPRTSGLGDAIVELVKSYRYDAQSGIGRLARAINAGLADEAPEALAAGQGASLVEPGRQGELAEGVRRRIVERYGAALREPEARLRLSALERFRVLCAHRRGPFGVEVTNALVERDLVAEGLVARRGGVHIGTPLLITRNDHSLRLYNGDVGLVAERDGEAQVLFRAADGEERWLSPSRLPPHETAFAMTVHKSQGSEFDEVVVLLPEEPSPVVTRELLYTAVTRARKTVTLHGSREALRHAIERRIQRSSGLRDLLWRDHG
jgi:exodeoxyribonuclease V alpha subunit